MATPSLFSVSSLKSHVGKNHLAVFAADVSLHSGSDERVLFHFQTLLEDGVGAEQAWLRVTGANMPVDIKGHLDLRMRYHSKLSKPKQIARLLTVWYCNLKHVNRHTYTAISHWAQRLEAFALMITPDQLASVRPLSTVWDTQQSALHVCDFDWALSAALTTLVFLTRHVEKLTGLCVSGSITPLPVSWHNVHPLIRIDSDRLSLPLRTTGNKYALLLKHVSEPVCQVMTVHASRGSVDLRQVELPADETPVWIFAWNQRVTVGTNKMVGEVSSTGATSWQRVAPLPPGGPFSKVESILIWKQQQTLHGFDVSEGKVVSDEEETLNQLCIDSAHTFVAACKNVVFAEGVALFALPSFYDQPIASVHRHGDTVDVFTALGDWWRVDVSELTAVVVGLDIQSGMKVVDACVY